VVAVSAPTPPPERRGRNPARFFKELPGMVLLAFALASLIKTFFF